MAIDVRFVRLAHGRDLPLPRRASAGAAGFDLHAALGESLLLEPGRRAAVPTGLVLELPAGYEGQVRPRSGLARRHGVTVLNSPGTVDSDYRGEIVILLVHLGEEPLRIEHGDRIAQLVLAPVAAEVAWHELGDLVELETTGRGDGGFGSTGLGATG
jgi:dUTP pyrophosphatase